MNDTEPQATERPSLESLDWSDAPVSDSPAETHSSEASSADSNPAAAPLSQPTPSQTDEQPRERRGPIPYDRHEAVLTKARNDAAKAVADAVEAERAKYGWLQPHLAQGLNAEVLEYLRDMAQRYTGDKVGFLTNVADDPQVQAWIIERARQLEAAQQEDTEPQADARDPNTGELYFSPAQQRKWGEWRERQLLGKVENTIKPLLTEREERIAQEEARIAAENDQKSAQFIFDRYKTLRGFTENLPAIREKWLELRKGSKATLGDDLGLAYAMVVVPTLEQTGQSRALADMKRAAHRSAINPQKNAPTTPASGRPALKDMDWS